MPEEKYQGVTLRRLAEKIIQLEQRIGVLENRVMCNGQSDLALDYEEPSLAVLMGERIE